MAATAENSTEPTNRASGTGPAGCNTGRATSATSRMYPANTAGSRPEKSCRAIGYPGTPLLRRRAANSARTSATTTATPTATEAQTNTGLMRPPRWKAFSGYRAPPSGGRRSTQSLFFVVLRAALVGR